MSCPPCSLRSTCRAHRGFAETTWARSCRGKPATGAAEKANAFAETDEQTLLADAEWRLVCARRAGACALYNLDLDPGETRDVGSAEPERFTAMKAAMRRLEAAQGRYERGEGGRRGRPALARAHSPRSRGGRRSRARDCRVARRQRRRFPAQSSRSALRSQAQGGAPELRLALSRDEDDTVRRWCALALTRLGRRGARAPSSLLEDPDHILAEVGCARSRGERRRAWRQYAGRWWQSETPSYQRARDVLAALAQIHAKDAAPVLVRSLDDVRLRPYVAETLAAIGQPSARAPLAERWATERYQNSRVAIGEALVKLGAKYELVDPLVRFLGTPDPLPNGLNLALRAGILQRVGGLSDDKLVLLRSQAARGVLVKVIVAARRQRDRTARLGQGADQRRA